MLWVKGGVSFDKAGDQGEWKYGDRESCDWFFSQIGEEVLCWKHWGFVWVFEGGGGEWVDKSD